MAESKYPSVYVVDSEAAVGPPLPPRPGRPRRAGGAAQVLLFLLVGVALCGLIIQACFIYRLFQNKIDASSAPSLSKLVSGKSRSDPPSHGDSSLRPSKPVAHLTDGSDVVHDRHVMGWSMDVMPLLFHMDYRRRSLLVQQEGYYYVYSKVVIHDGAVFHHAVQQQTDRHSGESITLLRSRKYTPQQPHQRQQQVSQSSSFLGGVFHLYSNDAIFVNVSDTARLVRGKSYENVFGAYMI